MFVPDTATRFVRIAALACMLACARAEIAPPLAVEPTAVGRLVVIDPVTRAEGKGLSIASYEAQIGIHGRLAETRITHVFANESEAQLEGTFYFPLPPGASMSRFAMDVNGALVEGEIVERRRGRAIYEDIVRSMKDPALLEMTEGNVFKARVFPIPARGVKTVVLAFTQELELADRAGAGALTYSLPLRSEAFASHHVGKVSIEVRAETAGGYSRVEHTMRGAVPVGPFDPLELDWEFEGPPGRDLVLTLHPVLEQGAGLEIAAGETAGEPAYFAVRDRAPPRRGPGHEGGRRVVFLIDTSASDPAAELAEAIALLEGMLAELGPADLAAVIAFDRTCVSLLGGGGVVAPRAGDVRDAIAALRARGSLGGSDLEGAFLAARAALASAPPAAGVTHDVVVLLGDGIATLGQLDPGALLAQLESLDAQLLPVPVGSQHNRSFLRAAARIRGGVVSVAIPGADASNRELPARVMSLAQPGALVTDLRATVLSSTGVETVHELDNVRPDGEIAFAGRVDGDPSQITYLLEGRLGGETWSTRRERGALRATTSSLLPRHWATGRIEGLLVEDQTPEVKAQVIELSERYRVMTPYTVFLVLESEEAYRQHQIERRADSQGEGRRRHENARLPGDRSATPPSGGESGDDGVELEEEQILEELEAAPVEEDPDDAENLDREDWSGESFGMRAADPGAGDEDDFGEAPSEESTGEPAEAPATGQPAPSPRPTTPAADKKVVREVAVSVTRVPRDSLPGLGIAFTAGGDATLRPAGVADQTALAAAIAAVDASPRSRAARKQLGLLLLQARDHERAASWARDWIRIDPRNLTPYMHLGKALANRALANRALANRALASQGEAHAEEALRAFTSLVDVRPGEARSHRLLGRMLVNYGLFDEAGRQFRLAMEDRPEDPSGLQDLAQLAVATGDFARAVDLFATLAERDWPEEHGPVRDLARQQLGLLYLRLEGRARSAGNVQAAAGWASRRAHLGDDHFQPRDVKVLINWDTTATDVDLWVTGPDGQKCFYSNKETPMGGVLYADITTGFGPEIYYLDEAAYGDYEVTVHYYSSGEADDTHVRALVVLFEGTPRQEIHEVDLTLYQKDDQALVGKFTLTAPR